MFRQPGKNSTKHGIQYQFADKLFEHVTYLTNQDATTEDPIAGNNGWLECFLSSEYFGRKFIIVCEKNRAPNTREFAISTNTSFGVELREVEIYGERKSRKEINYCQFKHGYNCSKLKNRDARRPAHVPCRGMDVCVFYLVPYCGESLSFFTFLKLLMVINKKSKDF